MSSNLLCSCGESCANPTFEGALWRLKARCGAEGPVPATSHRNPLRVRPEYEPDIRAVSARVVTGQFKAELESQVVGGRCSSSSAGSRYDA